MSHRMQCLLCLVTALLVLTGCGASPPTQVATPAQPTANEAGRPPVVVPISDLAAAELVVRIGPGEQYPATKLQLGMDQGAAVVGRTVDSGWLLVEFGPQQGWIQASQVTVPGSLSDIPILPTPKPAP